jgi:hypothetical protein
MKTFSDLIFRGARLAIHICLMILFMWIADTILVAHVVRIWKYTILFVDVGGALTYAALVFLLRLVAPDFWLVRK